LKEEFEDLNRALPIPAATFIVLMLVAVIVPVHAQVTPTTTSPQVTIVSIPEDDQVRQTGVMWFDPSAISTWTVYSAYTSSAAPNGYLMNASEMRADPLWGSGSTYTASENVKNTISALDPTGQFAATDSIIYYRKFSEYKLMVTYNMVPGANGYVGVPLTTLVSAGSALFFCEVYEKDMVEPKIPQASWELVKTDLTDVSAFYVCKLRDSGEAGVYVVDMYYLGPQTSEYVADEIVMFKVELLTAATGLKTPVWGMDMQDLCMLAWPFADPYRLTTPALNAPMDWQKYPHLIPKSEHKWIWSSPDPLDGYSNCAEAVLFQRTLMGATIPII
jgi:hypothetical protein